MRGFLIAYIDFFVAFNFKSGVCLIFEELLKQVKNTCNYEISAVKIEPLTFFTAIMRRCSG